MWTRILINFLFLNVGKASAQVVLDQYPALTAGDNLTLTCNVNEETNVTWKKDEDSPPERAKIDTRFGDRKSKLAITEVVKEDSGVYSCEAHNKLGFVALSFTGVNHGLKNVPSYSKAIPNNLNFISTFATVEICLMVIYLSHTIS